jgi:hypothetical protein
MKLLFQVKIGSFEYIKFYKETRQTFVTCYRAIRNVSDLDSGDAWFESRSSRPSSFVGFVSPPMQILG